MARARMRCWEFKGQGLAQLGVIFKPFVKAASERDVAGAQHVQLFTFSFCS